jgi:hypothetical protein
LLFKVSFLLRILLFKFIFRRLIANRNLGWVLFLNIYSRFRFYRFRSIHHHLYHFRHHIHLKFYNHRHILKGIYLILMSSQKLMNIIYRCYLLKRTYYSHIKNIFANYTINNLILYNLYKYYLINTVLVGKLSIKDTCYYLTDRNFNKMYMNYYLN